MAIKTILVVDDSPTDRQFIGNMPVVEFDGDRATGIQHFVFIDQQTHAMRLAWYKDEYVRTKDGWRIRRRSTTFLRKHGGTDSGKQHDPLAHLGEGAGAER